MRELFIYYQASATHTAALQAAVQAMQQGLRAAHPGLQARLLRRADDGPAPQKSAPAVPATPERLTWMETYAIPTGVHAGLQAEIAAAAAQALGPWLIGERHTEAFAACA